MTTPHEMLRELAEKAGVAIRNARADGSEWSCGQLVESWLGPLAIRCTAAEAERDEWKHRAIGGTCKVLSLGDKCTCSLCVRDNKIVELEARLAEAEKIVGEVKDLCVKSNDWRFNSLRYILRNYHASLAGRKEEEK